MLLLLKNREVDRPLNIFWQGKKLENCPHPKYLSVILDRSLTFRNHVRNCKANVSTCNKILRKFTCSQWGSNPYRKPAKQRIKSRNCFLSSTHPLTFPWRKHVCNFGRNSHNVHPREDSLFNQRNSWNQDTKSPGKTGDASADFALQS